MANTLEMTLHDSGAETASASGDAVDIGAYRNAIRLLVRVTALSGTTPSVICRLQTSPDGTTGWRTIATATKLSAIGKTRLTALECEQFVRLDWTIGGSADPGVTFSVAGEAHTVFANRDDIESGELKPEAIANVEADVINEALIDASCDAEDALAASNAAPITAWPDSLSRRVAAIASFQIMKQRGFRPSGFDELIVKAHNDAVKWLKDVGAGRIRPPGLAPATVLGPQTSSGNPAAPTRYKRRMSDNWGDFG